jgi:glycosyltransferase involved in cell wall biosynthesis
MIKIIHVCESFKGGVATIVNELLELPDNDSFVILPVEQLESLKPNVKHSTFRGGRTLKGLLNLAYEIRNQVERQKPDVIHLHSTFSGIVGRMVLSKYKNIIIYQPHGISFDVDRVQGLKRIVYRSLERVMSVFCYKIIAISKFELTQLSEILSMRKLVLIENGIKLDTKGPLLKGEALIQENKILFVGRLDEQKGLDLLLNYWSRNINDFELNVVGDAVLSDFSLNRDVRNTTFYGWLNEDELLEHYQTCKAIIMPSRWEGFGLVAIEALKHGKPVLCSTRGALSDIIEHEKTGYHFELENIEKSLDNAFEWLQNIDSKQIGIECKSSMENRFDSKLMNNKFELLYKQIKEK